MNKLILGCCIIMQSLNIVAMENAVASKYEDPDLEIAALELVMLSSNRRDSKNQPTNTNPSQQMYIGFHPDVGHYIRVMVYDAFVGRPRYHYYCDLSFPQRLRQADNQYASGIQSNYNN